MAEKSKGKTRVIAAVAGLTLSAGGLAWLAKEEGRRHVAYLDTAKVWTICDGHTGRASGKKVKRGDRATDEMCDKMLREDLAVFERAVRRCITAPITQNQFDALVVFAYNAGPSAVCGSPIAVKLNAGDCRGAAEAWTEFRKDKMAHYGVTKRRWRERNRFLEDCE